MDLIELLTRWHALVVFVAVLLEQGGLSLPAAPILVSAGALAQGKARRCDAMRPEHVLASAVLACLIADFATKRSRRCADAADHPPVAVWPDTGDALEPRDYA